MNFDLHYLVGQQHAVDEASWNVDFCDLLSAQHHAHASKCLEHYSNLLLLFDCARGLSPSTVDHVEEDISEVTLSYCAVYRPRKYVHQMIQIIHGLLQ